MLSEVSQRKENSICSLSYMESKQTNRKIKTKLIDAEKRLLAAGGGGVGG